MMERVPQFEDRFPAKKAPGRNRPIWAFLAGLGAVLIVGLPGLFWYVVTGDSPGTGNLAALINIALVVVVYRWFRQAYPWDGKLIPFLRSEDVRPAWRFLAIWAAAEWAVLLGVAAIP